MGALLPGSVTATLPGGDAGGDAPMLGGVALLTRLPLMALLSLARLARLLLAGWLLRTCTRGRAARAGTSQGAGAAVARGEVAAGAAAPQ